MLAIYYRIYIYIFFFYPPPISQIYNCLISVSVLESVCEDYRKETELKAGVCTPLPFTNSRDTLSTVITLWSHHAHVVTHQYPLKLLLRETQQLWYCDLLNKQLNLKERSLFLKGIYSSWILYLVSAIANLIYTYYQCHNHTIILIVYWP